MHPSRRRVLCHLQWCPDGGRKLCPEHGSGRGATVFGFPLATPFSFDGRSIIGNTVDGVHEIAQGLRAYLNPVRDRLTVEAEKHPSHPAHRGWPGAAQHCASVCP